MSNNISSLGQLIDNNARLRDLRAQLNDLQIQMSSGKKSTTFAGLGSAATQVQRVRVDLNQIAVYQTNIILGQTRIKQVLTSVDEFQEQAKNIADTLAAQQQSGQVNIDEIKEFAGDTLSYLRELLNSKDVDRYLLAGADAFTKPMDDNGAHGTYMAKLIEDWKNGVIDTDTLISSYQSTPDTTMGYSAPITSGLVRGVTIRADVSTDVDYTLLANNDGFKDILNALSVIQNLNVDKAAPEEGDDPLSMELPPGADADAQKENFFQLYENVIKTINAGIAKLDKDEQRLQRAQAQLGSIASNHTTDKFSLETTLDQMENADPTEVAVMVNALQVQITAAYQVTAALGQLTLSAFLN